MICNRLKYILLLDYRPMRHIVDLLPDARKKSKKQKQHTHICIEGLHGFDHYRKLPIPAHLITFLNVSVKYF
jgi:hypothetical protein